MIRAEEMRNAAETDIAEKGGGARQAVARKIPVAARRTKGETRAGDLH